MRNINRSGKGVVNERKGEAPRSLGDRGIDAARTITHFWRVCVKEKSVTLRILAGGQSKEMTSIAEWAFARRFGGAFHVLAFLTPEELSRMHFVSRAVRTGVGDVKGFRVVPWSCAGAVTESAKSFQWQKWMRCACRHGCVDAVEVMVSRGATLTKDASATAARHGWLQLLERLHALGCPFNYEAPWFACEGGHLECLRFVHGIGCEWIECAYWGIAWSGSMECLRYLHDNGCPTDSLAIRVVATEGRAECLRYMLEHHFPFDRVAESLAMEKGHWECVELLRRAQRT